MVKFAGKPNEGFETGWQFVPLKGCRELELHSGAGLDVTDLGAHKKIIDLKETTPGGVKSQRRRFSVKGLKAGETVVAARDKMRNRAQLVVEVKPRRVVKIAFNYVEDRAGHKTQRSPKTASALVNKLNTIFSPQANVTFQMVSAATLRINQDLGAVVKRDKKKPAADGFLVLVKNRVAGAQVNVFFVWECEKEGSAGETDGYAQIAVSKNEPVNCMVEDSLGASFEKVVAHEVGHNLGLKDDYTNPRLLMYGKTGKANGMLLTKTEIKTINP